jgi:hypothetical protein
MDDGVSPVGEARAAAAEAADPGGGRLPFVTEEQIANRAFALWKKRGQPSGTDRLDWMEARRQLESELRDGAAAAVPDKERNYKTDPCPVLRAERPALTAEQREMLLKLYDKTYESWKMLTDVRFKLVGLIPIVSITVLLSLLAENEKEASLPTAARLPIVVGRGLVAVFGYAVTLGLFIYEKRNTELYDDLVSRGRRIEAELGYHTGHFLGRKKSTKKLSDYVPEPLPLCDERKVSIQHDTAIDLIYFASMIAWLLVVVVFGMRALLLLLPP